MNGFRAAILVLLCLTVGLMFYVVCEVIPARQEQYALYRTQQKLDEFTRQDQEHMARMEQLGPDVESPEVISARTAAEEAQRKREQAINEAEESNILAAARRKQEADQLKQQAAEVKQTVKEASAAFPLGTVTAYDANWNLIMFSVMTNSPMNPGRVVAVRRQDGAKSFIVCEAVVDDVDEQSRQVSATIKPNQMAEREGDGTHVPAVGDEVIDTIFESADDLRRSDSSILPDSTLPLGDIPADSTLQPVLPAVTPAPANEPVEEIDAQLVPLP